MEVDERPTETYTDIGDQVRVFVNTDQIAWSELIVRDKTNDGEEDGL
jgi:hypothetical protein